MVEVSRIGFTLFPSSGVSEGLPRVNIIFVHGLRGHPRRTWVAASPDSGTPPEETPKFKRCGKLTSLFAEAKDNPDNGVFWPEELLAHDIPEARVWTYGFNADVIDGMFGANNRNKVTQHSGDLAVRLERELNNQDPIIFVAHSLGGVLVKDALARSDDTCARTRAVIFLGTPHRGSKSAGWGTTVANLSKFLLQDVNDKILRNLEVHGEMLEKIDEEFKLLVHKYNFRIHSFQEGRGISGVRGFHGKIVEDFSSKLGLPRNMETVETMDADHREMARCCDRSDPKYKAICEVLRQIIVNAPGSSRTGGGVVSVRKPVSNETGEVRGRVGSFLVPYLRNGRFVGRQSIVHALLKQPMGENSQSRTALFGLGGVGKTQIAIEYAYKLREAQLEVSVFWVFAANEERFKEGYASIAQHYKIPGYDDPKVDLLSLVQKWLLEKSNESWIMIVDNADSMDVMCNQPLNLGQYLPECSHGSILITTRNKQVGLKLTKGEGLVEIPTMGDMDSVELLRSKLNGIQLENPDALRELSSRLGHLPLALAQAASFIQENTISVRRYLELIDASDKTFTDLLSHNFETIGRDAHTPQAVAETWVLSFERIQQEYPLSGDLLSLMSFYDRQAIPKVLLSIYHRYIHYHGPHKLEYEDAEIAKYQNFSKDYDKGNLETELDPESNLDINKALGVLKAFSFITEGNDGTLSMHRLVQLVTQKWLNRDENNTRRQQFGRVAITTVSIAFPPVGDVMGNMAICSTFLPHAMSALKLDQDNVKSKAPAKARLYQELGVFHRWSGRLGEAETFCLQAIDIYQNIFGKEDQMTLTCFGTLMNVLIDQRKLKEAEDLVLKVLDKRKALFGEHHSSTMRSMIDLAYVYSFQERSKEEIELREDILQKLKDQNLQHTSNAIENMVRLGAAYIHLAQYRKAEVIQLEALGASKSLFGEQHTTTLEAAANLGVTYRLLREWEKSKNLLEQALETYQCRLGQEHEKTSRAMWELAELYLEQEVRLDKAEQMALTALETRKLRLGERQYHTLQSMCQVGEIWCRQGRFKDAVPLLEECHCLVKKVPGERDNQTYHTLWALCEGLRMDGKLTEAISAMEGFYYSSREIDGENHPNTLKSAIFLADSFYSQGAYDRAENLYLFVLERRKKQLGEESPDTLDAMWSLALIWKEQGRMEEAIGLMKSYYDTFRHSFGKNHCDTWESADVLRGWYWEVDRYDETEEVERWIYNTKKAKLGEDHSDTLDIMYDLAITLKAQGRLEEAISLMEDCVQRKERTLGSEHEDTVGSRKILKKWKLRRKKEKFIALFGA